MANVINATSTGNGGLVSTGDDSGILNIQTNETTAITVDASQNVGIGTASPAYKLDVNGNVNVGGNTIYLGNANVYATYRSGNSDVIYQAASGLFYYQNITSTYHAWFTGNTERMRINSSGNLLVGTTTTTGASGSQTHTLHLKSLGTSKTLLSEITTTADASHFFFVNPNGAVGSIGTSGTATAYYTSSDYRLKENIAPMTGALAKVAQLKPVTYKWKIDGSDGQGFIAHELQAVIPDCVTGEKDEVETYTDEDGNEQTRIKPQGIDTSFLVATLTAAIKELKAINDTQAETINALTARIVAIEGQ
jgi:hypothetical protein